MSVKLLVEFESFFERYKEIWNSCDADQMNELLHSNLKVRWAGPNTEVSDWGYKEACKGWRQAYEGYAGKNPVWHFRLIHMTPASENEIQVQFWVMFEVEGKKVDVIKLFVQRFVKTEENNWKLIREYCESLQPSSLVNQPFNN